MKHIKLFEGFQINESEEISISDLYNRTKQIVDISDEDIHEFKQALEEFQQMGCEYRDKSPRFGHQDIHTSFECNGQFREIQIIKTEEGYFLNLNTDWGYKCDSMIDVIDVLRNHIEDIKSGKKWVRVGGRRMVDIHRDYIDQGKAYSDEWYKRSQERRKKKKQII